MPRNNPSELKITFRARISLIIFGLFVFLVLLEAGLRLGGFVMLSFQDYRNRQSLAHKGTYRILCLGESTTAGQYPPFLEEVLNQRNIGIRFSVIDKGVVGTTTNAILSQFGYNLTACVPDMVITMMGSNDKQVMYYRGIPAVHTKLFLHLRVFRLVLFIYKHVSEKLKEVAGFNRSFDRSRPELLCPKRNLSLAARTSLQQGAELESKDPDVCLNLGQESLNQNRFAKAEAALKRAIELDPQDERARHQLERLYQNFPHIEDVLKKAIALDPQDKAASTQLVWLYLKSGNFPRAEDAFKKCIELDPQNVGLYIELGRLYLIHGKLSQAEDAFRRAIALNSQIERVYLELGRNYRVQGKLSQAEDAFKRAIALKPQHEHAYVELGWNYRAQGKFSQAEDAFKKAIALKPHNDGASGALLALYEEMGKQELAKTYAEKIAQLRSEKLNPITVQNYHQLKDIVDKKGMRLVCVQYPMRSIEPLKKIFQGEEESIIFVDNEKIFRDAVKKNGYAAYFQDMFAGDFGHCTAKGNRLLAENIANAILKEVFHK